MKIEKQSETTSANALIEPVKKIAASNRGMDGVFEVTNLAITPKHRSARDTVSILGAVRAPGVHTANTLMS